MHKKWHLEGAIFLGSATTDKGLFCYEMQNCHRRYHLRYWVFLPRRGNGSLRCRSVYKPTARPAWHRGVGREHFSVRASGDDRDRQRASCIRWGGLSMSWETPCAATTSCPSHRLTKFLQDFYTVTEFTKTWAWPMTVICTVEPSGGMWMAGLRTSSGAVPVWASPSRRTVRPHRAPPKSMSSTTP